MTEYNDILYIVVPCYNEEEVLHETSKRLKEKMTTLINDRKISDKSRVLFVDDGSKDRTWEIIEELHEGDDLFSGLKLSRNKGRCIHRYSPPVPGPAYWSCSGSA